ncbi:MAG TPA: Ig-like domain-containing protein, partial [Planctomycetota bacterium]|nr:Ig-like domain-containing protein [Planctomycetota bacterium]
MSLPRAGFPLLVGFLGLVLMSCGGGSGGGGTPPPEPPVNHAPVAPDQHLDLGWGAFVALAPGASDEDGDAISYTADSATNGWLGPDFTYQAPWQNGDFVATYRCDDGRGGISIGRFLISVRRANQPPTVDDIAVVTGEGVPVAIDLDAADGDGDALGYAPGAAAHGTVTLAPDGTTIVYAPAAGYIGSDSFAVVVSDGYGGSATADVDVLVEAGASSSFHEAWRLAFLGRQPGANGAIVDDVDGDGAQELLLAGGGMWSVLRATSRTNYERVHSREFPTVASPWYGRYAPGVVAFAVAHPAGRAAGFVAAARTDRVLEITDGSDWSLVRELPLAGDAVRLVVADADNDGDDDFVVLTTGHVLLYDATTFAAAGSFALPVAGTSDLAVGDVDGDHGLEIVLSSGHVVRFDGATVAPVWTYYQNFGYTLQLGDVSGDGIDDILASHAWYRISCYDVTTR